MNRQKNAAMTVKNIRFANIEKVMNCLLAGRRKTRNELAKQNGISLMTIKHIADALIAGGIVQESIMTGTELGRKPKILEISEEYGSIVCINLTVSHKISFLIYDIYENLIGEGSVDFTEGSDYKQTLLTALGKIKKLLKRLTMKLVGVAAFVPSAYYEDEDLLNYDLIKHFKNLHIKAVIKAELQLDNIMVIHDVFSAAKSEYDAPYVKVDSQFYCYFGTGVGGCFIHHNTPVMGKDLMAGEIGKMLVPDADGNYVMLEDIASVEAVRQNAVKSQAAKSFDDCMAKYKKGDKRAVAYLKPVLDTTARVIYNLLWAYNPDRIVIDSCCSEYSHIITQHVKSLLEQVKNEAIPIQTEVSHAVYDEYHTMHGCFYMVRSEWLKNIAKQNSN